MVLHRSMNSRTIWLSEVKQVQTSFKSIHFVFQYRSKLSNLSDQNQSTFWHFCGHIWMHSFLKYSVLNTKGNLHSPPTSALRMQSKPLFSIRSPQPSFWHWFCSRRQEPQPRGDGDPGRKAGYDWQHEQDVTKTPERASIETYIRLLNLVWTKTDISWTLIFTAAFDIFFFSF